MKFSFNNLLLLFLAICAISITACDDDDNGTDFGIDDDGTVFLSSNNQGTSAVVVLDNNLEFDTYGANGADADGIFYKEENGYVFQIDRTNNILVAYEDVVDDSNDSEGVNIKARSTSNFTNGRGLANSGNTYIVAQDASDANGMTNKFVTYTATDDAITLDKTINTNINLWGIRMMGNNLLAVKDNSDSLAIFNNFLSNADGTTVTPDRYIKFDGITRTHGLVYNSADDVLVMTDVADGTNDSDGAILVIRNFTSLMNNATIGAANYTRISGSNTLLGNPVDVAWDKETDRVYVAERAKNGGMLLIFDGNATGNTAPIEALNYAGASSIYLHRDRD